MLNLAPIALLISGLLLCCLVAPMSAQSCTSCGPECVSACGSRRYRTCCFNYLRKRRSPSAPGAPPSEQLALADLGAMAAVGGPAGAQGDALPDDLRLQVVVVPNDSPDAQDQFPPSMALSAAQSLFHRLLDAQASEAADGGGGLDVTNAPAAPPPVATQRHRAGGGTGAATAAGAAAAAAAAPGKDWLEELRHRVGLVYNV